VGVPDCGHLSLSCNPLDLTPAAQDYFDFVHAHNLAQPTSAVPEAMRDMYRCTRRGGYVELTETEESVFCDDGTMAETNALKRALDLLTSAKVKAGMPPATAEALTARLADVGFVDIGVATIKQPVGPWVKDSVLERVGALTLLAYEADFEAHAVTIFTRVFDMTALEATQLCRDALRDARDANCHMYCKLCVASAPFSPYNAETDTKCVQPRRLGQEAADGCVNRTIGFFSLFPFHFPRILCAYVYSYLTARRRSSLSPAVLVGIASARVRTVQHRSSVSGALFRRMHTWKAAPPCRRDWRTSAIPARLSRCVLAAH